MPEAITIDDFSFAYGESPILHHISFVVHEGDYVAVIGPNGAGKSTLIKCLNRILSGGQGLIQLFGRNVRDYSQKELGRMIGYVPQARDQEFPYTVYEFILMARYPYSSPLSRIRQQDKDIIEEAMSMCGITVFADRPVYSLSGGERQKVYLAAALAQQPKILLLDEPTAHLDPKYHVEIQKTICSIARKNNMTVLHATHDLNHLMFWSRKIIALKGGRVCFNGPSQEILNDNHLRKTFDVNFLTVSPAGSQNPVIIPDIE